MFGITSSDRPFRKLIPFPFSEFLHGTLPDLERCSVPTVSAENSS